MVSELLAWGYLALAFVSFPFALYALCDETEWADNDADIFLLSVVASCVWIFIAVVVVCVGSVQLMRDFKEERKEGYH